MTENEWLGCTDAARMLNFLKGAANDRRLRLFAVACVKRNGSESFSEGLATVENYVDGRANAKELGRHVDAWDFRGHEESGWYRLYLPDPFGTEPASMIARESAAQAGAREMTHLAFTAARDAERKAQCCLLRDIFADPFHPVACAAQVLTWNDGTIPKLAHGIYTARAFDRLPILADALEDAGCDNADILAHCRGGGEHVRGCWVIDQLLGKE